MQKKLFVVVVKCSERGVLLVVVEEDVEDRLCLGRRGIRKWLTKISLIRHCSAPLFTTPLVQNFYFVFCSSFQRNVQTRIVIVQRGTRMIIEANRCLEARADRSPAIRG